MRDQPATSMAPEQPRSPARPGRSYAAASGAFVRVDYVKPSGAVQCEIWPAWWESKADGRTLILTAEQFADLAERHDFQPVAHPVELEAA